MRKTKLYFSLVVTVLALALVSHAQTLDVLYNFCSQPNCTDGANPEADLAVDPATGNLWGTTTNGGANGFGTIFELTQSSGFKTFVQAYSFQGGSSDGAFPKAGLVFDPQTQSFYGTTSAGGTGSCSGGCGTIFVFVPGSGTEHVLHFFGQNSGDGATPRAELVMDPSQNFYGTTSAGGLTNCNGGCGTVFLMNPITNTYRVLYQFTGTAKADGADPVAGLVFDSQGNLWGTAQKGGTKNLGTVFELAAPEFTTLKFAHSFRGTPNGAFPAAALTFNKNVGGALGTLYGTTSAGGLTACSGGCGLVFQLEISSGAFTNIYKLTGTVGGSNATGSAPVGKLALDITPKDKDLRSGHLYGTASLGGIISGACPAAGCGTLFEVCPPTISCKGYPRGAVVFQFNGTQGANPLAGMLLDLLGLDGLLFGGEPLDGVLGVDGPITGKGACTANCVGTAENGGVNGGGVVVKTSGP